MVAFRAFLIVIWLLTPAFLVLICLWSQRHGLREWSAWKWLIVALLMGDWIVFVVLLIRSQTPYGMIYSTSALTHALLIISLLVLVLSFKDWWLVLASSILITLWIGIAYSLSHWMVASRDGYVKVDGQQARANVYFGYPTDSEAEAIAFVDIPGIGEYFLSFKTEGVRFATSREYFSLPGGIWVFRSMRQLSFTAPLPSKKLNQFRINSPEGREIEVQF